MIRKKKHLKNKVRLLKIKRGDACKLLKGCSKCDKREIYFLKNSYTEVLNNKNSSVI